MPAGRRSERASQVRECPHGLIEEHQPELADYEVERARSEGVGLGVGDDEPNVVHLRGAGSFRRDLRHWRGDVDPNRRVGDASCCEGEGAASAAHIKQGAMRCQSDLFEQHLGERR